MTPEHITPRPSLAKHCLTYRRTIAASVLLAVAACGGGGIGTTSPAPNQPPTSTAAKAIVALDKNFGGYALVGEAYEGFAKIVVQDAGITVVSSVMKNRTEGGATPEVGADGKVKWTANDKDFSATDSLQITAKLSNGEELAYDIPVEIRKQRIILKKTLDASENIYSDDEGRYLIQIGKKTGSSTIVGEILVNEMYRKNGEFTWSLKSVGDSFDLSILQAPMTQWSGNDSVATATKLQSFTQVGLVSGEGTTKHPIEKLSVGRGAFSSLHTNGSAIHNGTNIYSSRYSGSASYNIPGASESSAGSTTNGSSSSNLQAFSLDSFETFWFGSNCADNTKKDTSLYLFKCKLLADDRNPIILIHGFSGEDNISAIPFVAWNEGMVGGGEETWGGTAQYLTERKYPVFEMRWLSYMPFEDAAGALARFGEAIALETGKKPIILAHSFGGIVSHLALQNKGREWSFDVDTRKEKWSSVKTDGVFARLITLNSPLSGINEGSGLGKGKFNPFKKIYNSSGALEDVAFPRGVDLSDPLISLCYAVTCIQAGKNFADDKYKNQIQLTINKLLIDEIVPTLNGSTFTEAKSKDLKSGETIASIQRNLSTSNAPFTTVVGYKNIKNGRNDYYGLGDGLISLMGQALIPQDFSDQAFADTDTKSFKFKFDGVPYETLRGEKQKMLNTLFKGDCFKYKVSVREYLVCASSAHTSSKVTNFGSDNVNFDIPPNVNLAGYYISNPVASFTPGTSHILSILAGEDYLGAKTQPFGLLAPKPAVATVDMRFVSSTGTQQIGLISSSTPVKYALVWVKIIEKTSGVVKNQFLGAKSDENGKVNIDIGSMISAKFGADAKLEDYRVSLTVDPIGKLKPWRMEIESLQVSLDLGDIDLSPAAARVTSISPQTAQLGKKTTFIVSGQSLPMTAVLSMAGANCEAPTRHSITGFQVACTPGATIGLKAVTINTSNGGTVIDASKTVTVTAPSGLAPSYSIIFTDLAGATQAGWVVSPTVSFIEGRNGGKAAKFGGTASPGHIRIPNNDKIKFSGEATFDFWARIDSDTGMDGYGQTVTGQPWGMSLLAKSHDRNGVALESFRGGGLGLGSWDSSWAVAQGSCSYPMTTAPDRSAGVWHRITTTMSSTAGTRIYINGQLYEDCPTRRNSFAQMNTQDLYLGKFSDYWYPLNGAIQDVRIYQKALSEAEVKALQ